MRIAYALSWSRPTRLASHAQSIETAAALARHGHEVTLVAPRRPGEPQLSADGLRAHYGVTGDFALVQRERRWVSENFAANALWLRRLFGDPIVGGADLLLTRMPMIQLVGGRSPVPFAFDHYRRWPDDVPLLRQFLRRTARSPNCRGFILHSELAADSYRRAGVPEEKILVAHNGADPAPDGDPVAIPGSGPIALYAGRINETKGLDQVLALARLRPEVRFVLVGSEGDGPIERSARGIANVRVEPWQERIGPWLAAADLLLLPASSAPLERHRNSVLPIKLFAYLAAGKPILAPRAADTAELLVDGRNAILVPPDDPEAAARGLDRILADPGRLGAEAKRLAAGLTWDSRAAKITAFLDRSG